MEILGAIPDWLGAGLLAALTAAIGWFARRHWFPDARNTESDGPGDVDDEARRLLRSLQIALDRSPSSYVVNETTDHNAETANRLFLNARGKMIGTCFFESPDYGANDYARNLSTAARFHRITRAEVCDGPTADIVREQMRMFRSPGTLTVLPKGTNISLVAGMFCSLPDRSHLAFVSLNGTEEANNHGLVFCGKVAKEFFEYYENYVGLELEAEAT